MSNGVYSWKRKRWNYIYTRRKMLIFPRADLENVKIWISLYLKVIALWWMKQRPNVCIKR
jgi:hypothetical protein